MKLGNLIPKVFKPFDLPELSWQIVSRYNRNCWTVFYILSLTLPKLYLATVKTARKMNEVTVTYRCSLKTSQNHCLVLKEVPATHRIK